MIPVAQAFEALPSILIVCWHLVFVTLGSQAIAEDMSLRDDPCGKTTHALKYSAINLAFGLFFLVTYCVMPRGGEGARARAMLCTIIHAGLAAWGVLMCMHMSTTCRQVLADKFSSMSFFMYICVVHNQVMCLLFIVHETFLGKLLKFDMTVIFEVDLVSTGAPYTVVESSAPNVPSVPSMPSLDQSHIISNLGTENIPNMAPPVPLQDPFKDPFKKEENP
jgi:hypothetical protein